MTYASLHDIDAQRLRELLDATLLVSSDLDLPTMLSRIVESAAALVDARYGALGVLDDKGVGLSDFVTTGLTTEEIAAIGPLPKGHGILGLLIEDPQPLRLVDLNQHESSYGFPANHPPMKSFLGVPIRLRDQVFGNLYLTDKSTADTFTEEDERIVTALAGAAAIAIENARLHVRVRNVTLSEDRERIARDLHDTVIQRLFATGLSLQAALRMVESPDAARRVDAAISDLDDTITQIRTTIFSLESAQIDKGLRASLLDLAREAHRILGFEPSVNFEGPLDSLVPESLADDVLAVVREALSNTAKHAGANALQLTASVKETRLTIVVTNDGEPFDTSSTGGGGLGLRNLRSRAEAHGGSLQIDSREGKTMLRWEVPLP